MEILRNGVCISVSRGAPLMLNVILSAPQPAEPHEAPTSLQPRRRARRAAAAVLTCRPFSPERPLRALGARSGLAAAFGVPEAPLRLPRHLKLLKPLKVRSACPLLPHVTPASISEQRVKVLVSREVR